MRLSADIMLRHAQLWQEIAVVIDLLPQEAAEMP
jgi:hypothetical protein